MSLLVSSALVTGAVSPVSAAEQTSPPTVEVLPVTKSTPEKVRSSSIPNGEFDAVGNMSDKSPAVGRAHLSLPKSAAAQARELEDLADDKVVSRNEDSTTYQGADGLFTKVVGYQPLNAKVDGKWVPVSSGITSTASGDWEASKNPLAPSFSKLAKAGASVFAVRRDAYQVEFSLDGANGASVTVKPSADGKSSSSVTYKNVVGTVDLAYKVAPASVKETLVLSAAPKPSANSWTWTINAPGLTLRKDSQADIVFVDKTGKTQLTIPAPVMWDSSGVAGVQEPVVTNVDTKLKKQSGGKWTLSLSADPTWLSAPDRVYPVYIDPSVVPGADNIHSYKSDGTLNDGTVWIGNTRQSNTNVYWRTIAHYNYEQVGIPNQIIAATLSSSDAGAGTDNCFNGEVDAATADMNYNAVGATLSSWPNCATGSASDGGLLNQLNAWRPVPGQNLMLRGDEGSSYSYKALNTTLSMTYKGFPSMGISSATPNSGAKSSYAPTMVVGSTSDPGGLGLQFKWDFFLAPGDGQTVAATTGWVTSTSYRVPQGLLQPGTKYWFRAYVKDAYDGVGGVSTVRGFFNDQVFDFVTNTPAPTPPQASSLPATGTILPTLKPTFQVNQVADPDSATVVNYYFKVTTGADGHSGAIAGSGWITPTGSSAVSWTPPDGVLQDGGTYSWSVITRDDVDSSLTPAWVSSFKVDTRLGTANPSPMDSAGPASVNLANGNLALSLEAPTVKAVGGPMGMSFSYNSQKPSDIVHGLTGSYYNALTAGQTSTTTFDFTGKTPLLVRTDPAPYFDWGTGAPAPAVPADYFLARWTGFIRPPAAGTYTFGANHDDGIRATINGQLAVDFWTSTTGGAWGSDVAMPANAVPIDVDYYDNTGTASLALYVKGPGLPASGMPVPADWFTKTVQTLPDGWGSSTPVTGSSSAYVQARVTDSAVTLTDASGSVHTYSKLTGGAYAAPANEYGVLSLDATGSPVLTEVDGTVYTFNPQGRVASVTTPADTQKPATPSVQYRANGVADYIADPVAGGSNRVVRFVYSGDAASSTPGLGAADSDASGSACPIPVGSGYSAPPPDMLCRIVYPGHVIGGVGGVDDTTRLFYNSLGQLASIVEPGQAQTSFAYTNGLLSSLWDSIATDWVAADTVHRTLNANDASTFQYDASSRVQVVTLPAPDGVTAASKPQKTYTYGAGTTTVDVAGLAGHASTVTYDSALRLTSTTSAMGVTSSQVWNPKDQLLSRTDGSGLESTAIYDAVTNLQTDSYGPAPASCFTASGVPTTPCSVVPAHTSTSYDQGMTGLNVAYYPNQNLAGAPSTFSLGLGTGSGTSDDMNWGAGGPAAGVPVDNFSVRMTGMVTFPSAGTYVLKTNTTDEATRVWVDNVLVVDHWIAAPGQFGSYALTTAAGQRSRIRVEYAETTGNSSLALQWSLNGGATTDIPVGQLAPDYGLATGSTTSDSAPAGSGLSNSQVPPLTTSMGYGSYPWIGQVTTSSVDPSGLNLTTSTAYEAPTTAANSWLRPTSSTPPAGAATATIDAYYGDTEVLASTTCGVPSGTHEYGLLKSSTDGTPASGTAVTTQYVYDALGRTAGSKRTGDSTWTCLTYDLRGRVTNASYPSFGTAAARTVLNSYKVGGDPLTGSTSDASGTITTKSDLLGRLVSYTDVWGTVTVPTYESQTGRVTAVSTTPSGGSAKVQAFSFDLDGKVTLVKLDGVVVATPAFSGPGQLLASVAYGNGTSLSSIGRNGAGAATGITWTFPAAQQAVTDSVIRSQSGRVIQDALADGSTGTSTYSYDSAGRLVQAVIPGHTLTYTFAASNSCGTDAAAGKNGDRTGFTDVHGTSTTSASYCFDNADRLTSSVSTGAPVGANPVTATGLTSATLAYDAHGNTTTLADQTLSYDVDNRHTQTVAGTTTIVYKRDATDRITEVDTTTSGVTKVLRYLYAGTGDAPWGTADGTGALTQRSVDLPGGAMMLINSGGPGTVWAYPDLHGDEIVTANNSGVRATGHASYDPFGQPIDPTTGNIGTATSDDAVPATSNGNNTDSAWLGGAQKMYEHQATIATVEMGARQYVASIGRFLSCDPISGANANDYNYPNDPINAFDLTGKRPLDPGGNGELRAAGTNEIASMRAAGGGRRSPAASPGGAGGSAPAAPAPNPEFVNPATPLASPAPVQLFSCDRYCSDTWSTFGTLALDVPGLIYAVLEADDGNFDWSDTEGAGLFLIDADEWMKAENRFWVHQTGYKVF